MTTSPRSPGTARWVLALAVAYLVAHLPLLAPSLEDIDSINFALGLRSFNLVQHQPHPPGYPIYIFLGQLSRGGLAATRLVTPERLDALALALWSAIGGAVALVGAWRLYAAVERQFGEGAEFGTRSHGGEHASSALWPSGLLACAPLFWMCGLRPMSDMPGLAAVVWSQALLVEGVASFPIAVAGALLAGLGAGIRIQSLALTVPPILLVLLGQATGSTRDRVAGWLWRRGAVLAVALGVGVAVWAIPLVVLSGGLDGYLQVLGAQAGEDFAFVNMLWSDRTMRRLSLSVYETFVLPWHAWGLAAAVAVAAAVGVVVLAVRVPRAVGAMLLIYVPYLVYHLLFQETVTVRYALPVLPLVVWMAMGGVRVAWLTPGTTVVAGAALAVSVAGGLAYANDAHPSYRALAEARQRAVLAPPARVFSHFGLRRALQHGGSDLPFVEPSREYEWLGPEAYWREGGQGTVWFFGDPRRSDLALFDPRSRREVSHYAWGAVGRRELSGVRPVGVDWYRLPMPGWFAGEGWSLTPETAGLTFARKTGASHRPIEAWVRRRSEAARVVVGGGLLTPVAGADVELRVLLDGVQVDAWRVTGSQPRQLRFISLAPGALDGRTPYATLRIEARPRTGQTSPELVIQQFDVQSANDVVYGFGAGWYDAESEPSTGTNWRWTSERAVLELRGRPQRLRLVLAGESPAKYFDSLPVVSVESAGRVLRQWRPDADFETVIDVPPDVWQGDTAAVTISVDRAYLPGQAEGTSDTRRLGLRLFDVRIDALLP